MLVAIVTCMTTSSPNSSFTIDEIKTGVQQWIGANEQTLIGGTSVVDLFEQRVGSSFDYRLIELVDCYHSDTHAMKFILAIIALLYGVTIEVVDYDTQTKSTITALGGTQPLMVQGVLRIRQVNQHQYSVLSKTAGKTVYLSSEKESYS
jgi:hypothetical protein